MRSWSTWFKCLLVACAALSHVAAVAKPDQAETLRAKHASLADQLQRNQFGRPLAVESLEAPNRATGHIYAEVQYPFSEVRAVLSNVQHWCDIILLHINTKYCQPQGRPPANSLRVYIGKKTPESLASASRVDFSYRVMATTEDFLDIVLDAKEGPMGTSDYQIQLEASALPGGKSFLHLSYSYGFGFAGRMAIQTYLGTLGRGKVGFSQTGKLPSGQTEYVGGMRGIVERNVMRYYLAIDSFLASPGVDSEAQLERRLQSWFSAAEQYPRQLHEIERDDYLQMKRAENLRQKTVN